MQKRSKRWGRVGAFILAALVIAGIAPLAAPSAVLAAGEIAYLETDVMSTQNANVKMYPATSGTFVMDRLAYTRGIVNSSIEAGTAYDGTATYRIAGRGYTRLSGEFGKVNGAGGATLTITGDGKLLGGFTLAPSDPPRWLDVAIPAGTQEINIRLQNGRSGIFALADAYFATDGPTQPDTHPPATTDAAYLESDLISTQRSNINSHPALGSFEIDGIVYFRGVVNNNTLDGFAFDGTVTYRIAGRGYTRLSGEFGRVSGTGGATLTITGDGSLLGGYNIGTGGAAQHVDVAIPSGVQDVTIRLQNGTGGLFGFADAYFTAIGYIPPSPQPPAESDAAYLESDIISAPRAYVDIYPASGSFIMGGTTYFRGIVNNSLLIGENYDGSATYRIEGRGFTRLIGVFGRVSGTGGATLTVTADSVALGGFRLNAGDAPRQVDIAIPPGTHHVVVTLQNGTGGLFALADAYFTGGGKPAPSQIFTVEPVASPQNGGNVVGGGTYQTGTNITLTATPNPGWSFTGWFENGARVSTDSVWYLSVTANRTLEARFARRSIDNPHSGWATESLIRASQMNLIPDSLTPLSVDYTRPITRAEFAGIAVRTYEQLTNTIVAPAADNPFIDTRDVDVLRAYNAKIMVGVSDNEFKPNDVLTREMAAQALTRVFKKARMPGWSLETDLNYPLQYVAPPPFADDVYINYWAREGVYYMAANGIIQGMGSNLFAPRPVTAEHEATGYGIALREHAIIMALNLIDKLG